MSQERACDGCGCSHLIEDLATVGTDFSLCEDCADKAPAVLDHLIPERRPVGDDTLTPPLGDPDEAAHR